MKNRTVWFYKGKIRFCSFWCEFSQKPHHAHPYHGQGGEGSVRSWVAVVLELLSHWDGSGWVLGMVSGLVFDRLRIGIGMHEICWFHLQNTKIQTLVPPEKYQLYKWKHRTKVWLVWLWWIFKMESIVRHWCVVTSKTIFVDVTCWGDVIWKIM